MKEIKLLHDNTTPNTSKLTQDYILKENPETLPRLPYLPKETAGCHFHTEDVLGLAVFPVMPIKKNI